MKLIGYVRVSTGEQASKGHSLDAQEHRIRAYCEAHGHELVRVERDAGASGSTVDRPGLSRSLAATGGRARSREAEGIVAVKLDRLSRTTRDVLDLVSKSEREGWTLHSIEEHLDTSTPHGRFVVTILAAMNQLEREQIAARTRATLAHLRRQGKRVSGQAPYGYRFEGKRVVPCESEAGIVSVMEAHAGSGPAAVARELNARGYRTREGSLWTRQRVWRVLKTAAERRASA